MGKFKVEGREFSYIYGPQIVTARSHLHKISLNIQHNKLFNFSKNYYPRHAKKCHRLRQNLSERPISWKKATLRN